MACQTEPSRPAGAACDSYEAIVLGAGISGLVSASVLLRQGCRRILIVDEFDRLGGNHIDCSIGPYTFDIGSFIFQDDSPLLDHFPEMLPSYIPVEPSWGKLNPQGMVTRYPLSIKDDIVRSGLRSCAAIFGSLIYARLFHARIGNARDFARYWIGEDLLRRSGLEKYMERFFGIEAERVDLGFAQKRMMWIAEHASLRGLSRRVRPRRRTAPTNRQLVRPREGFQPLYEIAAERLRGQGVDILLGAKPAALRRSGTQFELSLGSRLVRSQRMVSTIPIDRTLSLCGLDLGLNFDSVTLISLFFSFKGRRGFDYPILYNFSHEGAWKRLTMYSDFYGPSDAREYFGVEVIASQVGGKVEAAEADFRKVTAAAGLFQGDLVLEGARIVPYAYPIYVDQAERRVSAALSAMQALGVESFGRQGGFDYQPTARVSTIEAETVLGQGRPA
ncbi:FAD-binding protein [Methylobacterium tarhaniae]|uniref:FAD-binding protein n=1 Tax=Methylobacterium tarhaniae TaxID=1187852 RepID=A0A0J6SHK3_9HYPH|nr:NAD(P)/FAD-dependent oxidoreductase [Methylobacterium tarhaniae]KMO33197.1 FAD-binding protein [Methylobacterium tarhaniae]